MEALHACVHSSLAPFFNAFVRANAKDGGSSSSSAVAGESVSASVAAVGAVKQKLDDLEVSLFNAKQNVQIETVVLDWHPQIREAAEKARAAGRTLKADDLASRANDAEFLNQLQASVNGWIQKIERVTKLERIETMPPNSDTMQEISFWTELEAEVAHIDEQLRSAEAVTSMALLKQAKRYWATMAFDTDTVGLKKAADLAHQYAPLTSDLPLTPLRQAVSVEALRVAVVDVFAHLQRAGAASSYPIERHLRLVEALARDVGERLIVLLSMRPLLTLDANEADAVAAQCAALFGAWRDQFGEYHGMLRKLAKRRGQNKLAITVAVDNKPLEERIAAVRRFRRQHEQLRSVIATALPADALDGRDAAAEIAAAYAVVQSVDVLADRESVNSAWDAAVRAYDERVERVEAAITAQLRERLATAQSANEMFRVCTKFNALFYRPRVRGAVREYQAQLISRVKDDIRALHDTFKQQYPRTEASHVAKLRDVPPVSGAIIWARQLERQLAAAMARVENVLGHGWELDVDGARLAADAERFRAKLNVDAMFEHWVKDTEARALEVVGRVLDVRKRSGGQLVLDIHFAEHLITLFKEVRNLQWLGFRVPFSITQPADRAKVLYPFAVSLRESLRAYDAACSHVESEPSAASIALLVAALKRDVQALVAEGFRLRWEAWSKLNPFVRKLGAAVQLYSSKSEEAIARSRAVRAALDALATCDYDAAALRDALARIQAVVDELELASFSNLAHWLAEIEARVVDILEQRLVAALAVWNEVFSASATKSNNDAATAVSSKKQQLTAAAIAAAAVHDALRAKLTMRLALHEIVIRNQQMTLEPPLESARERWVDYLHQWLSVVCSQERLRASRYNESLADGSDAAATRTYRDVLGRIGGSALGDAFGAIERRLREVGAYVDEWLRYQALWDLEPAVLYDRLGDDVERWRRVLVEIKKSRATFDNAATRREFGPIVIDYAQVQQQVNTKYDYWHRDALSTFGTRLGGVMRGTHEELAAARQALETLPLDASSPAAAVAFIVALQRTKRQVAQWAARVESLDTGQQLLRRARYAFAADWLDFAMVEGEWSALGELLRRKEAAVESHIPVLQQRVRDDTASLDAKVGAFVTEWPSNVANNPSAAAQDALLALAAAEGALKALHAEHERLTAAREALELGPPAADPRKRLEPVSEELEALRGVWNALGDVWRALDLMGEQQWATIQPRKVRKELEAVLESLKQMPSRVRQYDAFGFVQARVKELLKHNIIVADLHSEALRERHWRELRKRLNVNWVLSELTLGDIWRADLTKNGAKFRDVITQAQGELALEEFLKSVREHWQAYQLELVPYQSKCMLIKGWDELFTKLSEHLGSLSSMKMSPFFKVFEDDHAQWDDKLNRTRALFDVWIDVQRRWVYLESIFTGSGDIAALLPKETARFRSLNQEFLTLMRRVAKAPAVLEVLAIDGVQRAVEHLLETLLKVQKALGDYLERQRASFPRFYFIGDDDLLEIIGNSKDLDKTQKHLRKMFAGVASLTLADENARIVGMSSAEGETVQFHAPIVLANVPKVHEWLTALEQSMRGTLARLMRQCHAEAVALDFGAADKCMDWIARWPAQLVQLAMQVLWTGAVERALERPKEAAAALDATLARTCALLDALAEAVMRDLPAVVRQKFEHLVTELVHQRDVTRSLRAANVDSAQSFAWLTEMRYYYTPPAADATADSAFVKALQIRVANAAFDYGWEYLGVGERLVQTPLTSRAYLTLTQALHARMGGSPFGPAGTGKCLARGTPVLMADGRFRAVELVKDGEAVMGDDGTPRIVTGTTRGQERMVQIMPRRRDKAAAAFVCNASHILSLKLSTLPALVDQNTVEFAVVRRDRAGVADRIDRQQVKFESASEASVVFAALSAGDDDHRQLLSRLHYPVSSAFAVLKRDETVDISVAHFLDSSRVAPSVRSAAKLYHAAAMTFPTIAQPPSDPYAFGAWLSDCESRRVDDDGDWSMSQSTNDGVPDAFKYGSVATRRQLLAGICDAAAGGEIALKSEQLLADVEFVARSLGFDAERTTAGRLAVGVAALEEFSIQLVSPCGGDAGWKVVVDDAAAALDAAAVTLEKLPLPEYVVGDFFGFQVSGNGRFVVGERCYVTHNTETAKALGTQLGRYTLVFCCDDSFDLKAVSRILIGLCMCGAWGVFDEFNRLEERILSAVSQQIQVIQEGLAGGKREIELGERTVPLSDDMGIFVTMNPGYAGRTELPQNLKQLFRGIAMISPDRELIAQVMLFSQGYKTAERLSSKIVPLFRLCAEQLSSQAHYDFGLRALKSVLVSAGRLKRHTIAAAHEAARDGAAAAAAVLSASGEQLVALEAQLLMRSVCETVLPKLVAADIGLFHSLLRDVFPGVRYESVALDAVLVNVRAVCAERQLLASEAWLAKVVQLYQMVALHHGLMMVGPSAGKTTAWQVLLEALERTEGVRGASYVLDPKAITKDELFGTLDATTREWTDGLFTHLLRRIIDNVRGDEHLKRHWIIFDGDVDPEWVENLNALLDDNRILTLPNGERLALPHNVRIMFEVQHLRYATPATVSRCGMVFFSQETLPTTVLLDGYLLRLRARPTEADERAAHEREVKQAGAGADAATVPTTLGGLRAQRVCADALAPHLAADGFVLRAIEYAEQRAHVMTFTRLRVLENVFAILNKGIAIVTDYNAAHGDFPLDGARTAAFIEQWSAFAVMWGVGGSMSLHERELFARHVADAVPFSTPDGSGAKGVGAGAPSLLDYGVQLDVPAGWQLWSERVPRIDIETHQVGSPDLVIATVDTVRHEAVLHAWLHEHRPLLLCGPPGSGKSMTLQATLQSMPEVLFVSLNFSSATTPELLMNTFAQYCEYTRTASGDTVLRPTLAGKWLVVFCDEINLPAEDRYGTQRVITFLRQLTERGGFWRSGDHVWVTLERVQFVGACNPPTDPGRVPLTTRFLRHTPLLLVDFPSRTSLVQIYGTFCRALLKLVPPLRAQAPALTEAMIDIYSESAVKFTPDVQPHYIYSPRELSRWVRALHTALAPLDGQCSVDNLVRLWAHEGLRLFADRLVLRAERAWTDALIDRVAARHFGDAVAAPGGAALARPILFSKWLSSRYESVQIDALREYVQARLKVFYEEELDVPVVLFDEVLEHILRIDRVFRQPQGHALLVGVSGGGKTLLSRFVAWLGGLSVFTIKVNNRYTAEDFDDDLRSVMKRAGCNDEKICFIFDESNVLGSAFLERMNTLLAGGEVPGLFEGEEYTALMHQCKDAANRAGQLIDGHDELYRFFVAQVRRNLHIVFTMNPASGDFHNRSATSPALFNRMTMDWFGDWPDKAFQQVASEFTHTLDIDDAAYEPPAVFPVEPLLLTMPARVSHRDAVIASLVYVHSTITVANQRLQRTQGRTNYVTPRHFLDFIGQFVKMLNEKRAALEEEQLHLNVGLRRLTDTAAEVQALQTQLAAQNRELTAKNVEANEKLKQMVADQQVAEEKRRASVALQAQLDERNVEIQKQKASAYADLEKAEPALINAQQAVSAIQKKHLDELRALPKPPDKVRWTLEAVAMMLEGKPVKLDWADIRKLVSAGDFVTRVAQFDSKSITRPVRAMVMKEYTSLPDFNAETINRASRACGPLAEWVIAQVFYSDILERVAPLRQQVESLEAAASALVAQQRDLQTTVQTLEASIARYKTEYAALISETERIKTTMADVERRVTRSVSLLDNLGAERDRWRAQSASFQAELATMVGDVLVSAAFLAYAGFFDQQYRDALRAKWCERLRAARIALKENLSVSAYLSTPEDRLAWHANALPADELSTENAVMLQRFNRYPLVIDPSGQAAEFLLRQYASRRITKTSFLDASFMKNLEAALRFGTPLLVQDVENIDPVVNPVLNKEIYKKGGRVLIRLGDQDIDFSPTFVIFLVTRDPTAHFTPDLCSRVTFVNFTVTPAGLLAQLAHETLRVERPDVHERRTDVLRLQGEYRVRLRALEKSLLAALNEAEGNLLDNDTVLATLERLKHDAADVARKAADADAVMAELTAVSRQYAPFAKACASIYFALEELAQVHFLYQFSLPFFFDIFNDLLAGRVAADGTDARAGAPRLLDGIAEHAARLSRLGHALFRAAFRRVSRSLLHGDYVTFGVRLAQIALQLDNFALPADELEFLLRGGAAASAADPSPYRLADELARVAPEWKELGARARAGALAAYSKSTSTDAATDLPLEALPSGGGSAERAPVLRAFRAVLLAKALRSDRVPAALEALVEAVFERGFLAPGDADLAGAAARVGAHRSPLLLAAAPGFDAGLAVETLAQRLGKRCASLAIGSPEGFGLAETALGAASSGGTWLLLKNVHLAPAWLVTIEKRLHTLTPHADFRLFLTAEMSEQLPRSLLRLAQVFVFEKPPGLKASLQLTFGTVAARANRAPVERARLYFLVHWFHAVVLERLRYAPLGWSKAFEFGESDLTGALDTLDEWLDAEARGKSNVAPERIPWAALRALLGQSIYGGRLDNTFDQRLLDALLEKLFSPRSFDAEFALVDVPGLRVAAPEGTKADAFQQWIDALPAVQTPAWLGLPADAERPAAHQQRSARVAQSAQDVSRRHRFW
jgi:hypothetical protein